MSVFDSLAAYGVVPVVEIPEARWALPLAQALAEGGLSAIEVTLRTPDALESIAAIAAEFPDFLVGAGTLLNADNVARAAEAGSKFGVSPGFTVAVGEAARAAQLPLIPGAVTAGEFMAALEAGFTTIKFFPAEISGGARALGGLLAPLGAGTLQGVMPTGGVTPGNLADYLLIPKVIAAGGTWIAPRHLIAEENFAQITINAREAVALVQGILAEKKVAAA